MIGVIRALLLFLLFVVFVAGALIVIVTCVGVYHEAGRGAAGVTMAIMLGLVFGAPLIAVLACVIDDWIKGDL